MAPVLMPVEPSAAVSGLGTADDLLWPETRLYSEGVCVGRDLLPVVIPPGSDLAHVAGTSFLQQTDKLPAVLVPDAEQIAAWQRTIADADLPGRNHDGHASMAERALSDLMCLTAPTGAFVAAGSVHWRYVWPRDAAFAVAALLLVGDASRAERIVRFVAGLQEDDGTWQARYLPDGSRCVPDHRGTQLDNIGWFLWSTWLCHRAGALDISTLQGCIRRAAAAAAKAINEGQSGLPRPSQDYWEVEVVEPTLGVAAPLRLGLRCAALLCHALDDGAGAEESATRATQLSREIERQFGAQDYPRHLGGGGRDASVAFLLPPFAEPDEAQRQAWHATYSSLRVANGGLRPGEDWDDLETGWTPQISLFALAAAGIGENSIADALLAWLDARRTRLGSLPEKVTAAGNPAAVAPLGLTAATVLMTLAAREGRHLPVPPFPPSTTRKGSRR